MILCRPLTFLDGRFEEDPSQFEKRGADFSIAKNFKCISTLQVVNDIFANIIVLISKEL